MLFMFMIAGYVHAMKERYGQSFLPFAKKYFIEIYLPCMYFSFIQIFIMLTVFSSSNPANFGAVKPGEIYAIPFAGFKEYWFLAALFFVKLLHTFLECRVRSLRAVSVFWIAVFIIAPYLGRMSPSFLHNGILGLTRGLYFHAGYLLKRCKFFSEDKAPKISIGIMLFLAGFALFIAEYIYGVSIPAVAAICTSLALFVVFNAIKVNYAILVVYGVHSMVVYCLHNWIVAVFRMSFKITGLASSAEPVILFIMCFPAAVLLPLLVVWLYRNVKPLHWIEYIFYPGRLLRH